MICQFVNRLKSLETIVNEVKKSKNYNNGDYAALMEEKDQEYKTELKKFLTKVKSHIEESSSGSHPENGKLLDEIRKKLKSVEQVRDFKMKSDYIIYDICGHCHKGCAYMWSMFVLWLILVTYQIWWLCFC